MELFHELLLTLLVAIFISFLIANVVSSRRSADQNGVGESSEEVIAEELNNAGRMEAMGLGSEVRAELVGEAAVDRVEVFVREQAPVKEESTANERRELIEKGREAEEEVQTPVGFVPEEMKEGVTKLGDDHQNLVDVTVEKTGAKQILADESKEGNSAETEALEIESAPHTERPEETGTEEGGASDEVVEEIDIEDDWQGIERSDLENEFAKAAKFVESGCGEEKLASVGSDVVMDLYGLHKLVTEGPCHEQPPMPLKLSARAKWNAWQKLGNMDPEVAMKQYVNLVSDSVPHWMEEQSMGDETVRPSLEAADAAAKDISTPSSHGTNFPYEEGGSGPKYDSETNDSTGGLNLESKNFQVKE
ncbi:Acyl-CoA-binding domain-containing protein 3 [Linum perenne]